MEFSGAFAAFLTERAQARQAHCAVLATEWVIEPAGPEPSDLDDAQRRARSGVAAFAELVATLEFAIVGILKEMTNEAIAADHRERLVSESGVLRARVRDEQLTVRSRPAEVKVPDASPAAEGAHQFDVYFATNRTPIHISGALVGFGSGRSEEIHHGRCEVTIPETHRIGSTGSPWWRRIGRGDDRLRLAALTPLEPSLFWQEVRGRINETVAPGDAIVFINGFNVSFLEASLCAAQIGADLALDGVTTFFSWPSRGTVLGYPADEATIEASEPQITRYLVEFAERSGARGVHIIAHSMGNRGLLRAVDRIAASASALTRKPFGQIILAAPDVDSGTFRGLAAAYPAVSVRTTLYVSSGDLAVRGSRLLHGASRVGFTPPIAIVEGIDTVSAKNVDVTRLGHGYVASSRPVLVDIHDLIKHGSAPDDRATLRRRSDTGQPFWEFAD